METDYAQKKFPDLQPEFDPDAELLDFAIKCARYLGYDSDNPDVIAGLINMMRIGR